MKKLTILLNLTIFLLVLSSCVQNKNESSNDGNSKEIVDQNMLEIKALADSLELSESEYQHLMVELKNEENKNKLYYRKIHLLQSELDSIKTQSNALKEIIGRYENIDAPTLSENEQEIVLLVHHMHASWKKMPIIKNTNEILQYFMPRFIVNQVSISEDSKGAVLGYTHDDYENYLKEIINREGYSYEFGNVSFLDIIVKDNDVFNVVYKSTLRTYKEDKQLFANAVIVTITGKKQDEGLKVANYNIVGFKYQTLMNITL